MKKYAFFPGCSLEKMAISYNQSSVETTKSFGIELQELEDWNCCGASAAHNIDYLLSLALPARNLALAEKQGFIGPELSVPPVATTLCTLARFEVALAVRFHETFGKIRSQRRRTSSPRRMLCEQDALV